MAYRFLLSVIPFLWPAVSFAAERHLGPHVHGEARVDVSIVDTQMRVELRLPGHDAVGFEHPPSTDDEKAHLAQAIATLRSGHWLEPSSAAECHLDADADVKPVVSAEGHADMVAVYTFDCARADRLDGLDMHLTDAFPSVQRIVVDTISSVGSAEHVLERGDVRVDLTP